jgi:hypothetical protein
MLSLKALKIIIISRQFSPKVRGQGNLTVEVPGKGDSYLTSDNNYCINSGKATVVER